MIVVDSSAVLGALAGRPLDASLQARLIADGDLHAPHLIDLQIVHGLRRLLSRGQVSEDTASDVRSDLSDLRITRYPHHPFVEGIWELRHHVSPYDAVFIALAETLDAPLVTCDGHLARAGQHKAKIELFGEA